MTSFTPFFQLAKVMTKIVLEAMRVVCVPRNGVLQGNTPISGVCWTVLLWEEQNSLTAQSMFLKTLRRLCLPPEWGSLLSVLSRTKGFIVRLSRGFDKHYLVIAGAIAGVIGFFEHSLLSHKSPCLAAKVVYKGAHRG